MQENIALAIKTALEENKEKIAEKSIKINADLKRPDLFSYRMIRNYFKMKKELQLKLIDLKI